MFAIAVENESLVWQETEAPHGIASDEVRIEVAWAGVNRADLMQRRPISATRRRQSDPGT